MSPVDEKQIKAEFRKKAGRDPEKYYPVEVLKEEGFSRGVCRKCGTGFWSVEPREVCGEPDCSGGYTFIDDSPASKKMDFIETWQRFSQLFEGLGYTPIQRYPVVARWRDDADFVQASIYDFQPYVVSGEVEPPANPLVVPQFCLRFNDMDNVGYTGRHYTGFVMIGQHAFEPPERYNPPDYLRHIYTWLVEGMGVPKEEVQFHEDTWAGGGNMGPSMEFFSRGLEIGNQVYMQYDIRTGTPRELAIKVLDMGMGQERPAWFTHGTATSYEANFGEVIEKLYKETGIKPDQAVLKAYLPYSGLLNFDETDNIERVWRRIAREINVDLHALQEEVVPLAALYSVADHTRSLLVALADGALPSNVGGGYNLRTLFRRALDLLNTHEWDLELIDICTWHSQYLTPQYPELSEHLDEVAEILEVERKRHGETQEKSRRVVASLKDAVDLEKLITLYDSQGITPQMLSEAGLKVDVPSDFYAKVSERHEKSGAKAQTKKDVELPLEGVERTEILYYEDYLNLEFSATVLRILDNRYVVLDKTAFYPTSGGQLHDIGKLDGSRVTDIFKQGNLVVHVVESPAFKEGDKVIGWVERDRRVQLAQHHTATHIINGVARKVLGEHIWQAGAEKTLEKARLDITHYEALSVEQLNEIEKKANEIILNDLKVESKILKRDMAESLYGFRLYQGGAVPGRELRIVRIDGLDVEACGGTHLQSTSAAGLIKLMGSTKIQDGIVRLEFTAGMAGLRYIRSKVFDTALKVLESIIRADVLEGWSPLLKKKLMEIRGLKAGSADEHGALMNLDGISLLDGEIKKCAVHFSVQISHLEKTLERFMKEIEPRLRAVEVSKPREENDSVLYSACEEVFRLWKECNKRKKNEKGSEARLELSESFEEIGGRRVLIRDLKADRKVTLQYAKELSGKDNVVVLFGTGQDVTIVASGVVPGINMGELVSDLSRILGGGGGGKPDFGQGAGRDLDKLDQAMGKARERLVGALQG